MKSTSIDQLEESKGGGDLKMNTNVPDFEPEQVKKCDLVQEIASKIDSLLIDNSSLINCVTLDESQSEPNLRLAVSFSDLLGHN